MVNYCNNLNRSIFFYEGENIKILSKERSSPQQSPPSTTSPAPSKDTSCEEVGYILGVSCQLDSNQGRVHPALPKLLLQGRGPSLSCRCWRRGGRRRQGWRRRRGGEARGRRGASWSSVHPILGATDNYSYCLVASHFIYLLRPPLHMFA